MKISNGTSTTKNSRIITQEKKNKRRTLGAFLVSIPNPDPVFIHFPRESEEKTKCAKIKETQPLIPAAAESDFTRESK
ncbi:MAG: hypothetical protein IJK97_10280 [Thermoguttaceae bacterium]|nr:hypothetical protein [Thermoguttaceae bacterium]MBR0192261.1 hypothetical protein [Thermoguttaceae bacterium]